MVRQKVEVKHHKGRDAGRNKRNTLNALKRKKTLQHELSNEIANAISNPVGFGAEIYELENELAPLEQEELSKEMAQINLPTVPAHSVPAYAQPAGKAKNDQLAELERWAS